VIKIEPRGLESFMASHEASRHPGASEYRGGSVANKRASRSNMAETEGKIAIRAA